MHKGKESRNQWAVFTGYTADCNTARYVTHSQAVKTDEPAWQDSARPDSCFKAKAERETAVTHTGQDRAATGTALQSEMEEREKVGQILKIFRVNVKRTWREKPDVKAIHQSNGQTKYGDVILTQEVLRWVRFVVCLLRKVVYLFTHPLVVSCWERQKDSVKTVHRTGPPFRPESRIRPEHQAAGGGL